MFHLLFHGAFRFVEDDPGVVDAVCVGGYSETVGDAVVV